MHHRNTNEFSALNVRTKKKPEERKIKTFESEMWETM